MLKLVKLIVSFFFTADQVLPQTITAAWAWLGKKSQKHGQVCPATSHSCQETPDLPKAGTWWTECPIKPAWDLHLMEFTWGPFQGHFDLGALKRSLLGTLQLAGHELKKLGKPTKP